MAAVSGYDSWVNNDDSWVENDDSWVEIDDSSDENDDNWVENAMTVRTRTAGLSATCEVAPLMS